MMIDTSYWLLRHDNQVFTSTGASGQVFPLGVADDFGVVGEALPVGHWHGFPCYAADVERLPENLPGELTPVRSLFHLAGAEAFALAARAISVLDWRKNHRYCGRCGTLTNKLPGEFAMACPSCALTVYPRISPAVMVLIRRGDKLLLARGPNFRPGIFSALAGFVEAGETLEECVHREVREEVGLEVTNLRYFRSQPWPFPDSLMVAFFADYLAGEITPDPKEIESAGWYSRDALPPLPDPVSIARQLIDAALAVKSW